MKKRRIAGVLALILFVALLSGCQPIRGFMSCAGSGEVQAQPLPTGTPKFQLFAATEENHLKMMPVPEGYTVYDHGLFANTVVNSKTGGRRTDYSLSVDVCPRVGSYNSNKKTYRTTCRLSLRGYPDDFSFDSFKQEGVFLWRALEQSHNLDEDALDAGLKALSAQVQAGGVTDNVTSYSYTSNDLPGAELEYEHISPLEEFAARYDVSASESLVIKLYNEIPEAIEEQGRAFTQLADLLLSALAEQKVPIENTRSEFKYIKTDRSDDVLITTDLSHIYDDFETYAGFSKRSEFELKGSVRDTVPSREGGEDYLQDGLLYTGMGESIFGRPVDTDAFGNEAKIYINQWEMSDETRSQLLAFIDQGTIKTGSLDDALYLRENDVAPNVTVSYRFTNNGNDVHLIRTVFEKTAEYWKTALLPDARFPNDPNGLSPQDITQDTVR